MSTRGDEESEKGEFKRIAEWLFILAFFVIIPAATLYAAAYIVRFLRGAFVDTSHETGVVVDFFSDLPLILLTFYSGAVGGVVSYVYARTQLSAESDLLVTKMAKFVFAGTLGVVVFLFLRSAALVKVFYPSLPTENINSSTLNYHSLLFAAFLAGLLGPVLVRGIQSKSRSLIEGKNAKQK